MYLSVSGAAWGTLGQSPGNTPVPSSGPRAAPALINNGLGWDGLNFSATCATCVPADAQIASGSGYVVELVNGTEEAWTTGGTVVGTKTLDTLFNAGSDAVTDPQVHYDPNALRWFASADDPHSQEVLYAASQTSDPTGVWNIDHFTLSGPDTPKQTLLGVNSVNVVLTTNVFNKGDGSFVGAEVYVVNKTQLVAGGGAPSYWTNVPVAAEEALVPAETTSTSNAMYLVSDRNGSTTLSLFEILGTPPTTTPTLSLLSSFTTTYTPPPSAVQSGSSNRVSTEDGRIESATWRGGALWAAATTGCHAGGNLTVLSCLHLWEDRTLPGATSIVQDFNWNTGAGTYDFYPAIATDPAGDMTVVFGESSTTMDPSVLVTQQTINDAPATLETPTLLKIGTGPDQPHLLCTASVCPFGAYFGAAYEPLSGSRVWVVGEYTSSSSATTYWNTWIGSTTTTETEPVNFSASGLPPGSAWSVTLSGDTVASSATSIVFNEPVGTYTFTVTTPITGGSGIQYVGSPSSGSLTVASHALSQPIVYTKQYRLTTAVTPVAAGTVTPGQHLGERDRPGVPGRPRERRLRVPGLERDGSRPLQRDRGPAEPHDPRARDRAGRLRSASHHHGLLQRVRSPPGTNWSVNLNGIGESSAATSIDFNVTSGHFSYVVTSPIPGANGTRYVASPTVGSFSQNSSNTSIPITFAAQYRAHDVRRTGRLGHRFAGHRVALRGELRRAERPRHHRARVQ